jgi:CubicO group peptidase (beta-lactamase class C family)
LAQPDERWLYNTGAHVLSVLCARAAAMSYDEVLRTRIFEPLGMLDTGFHTVDVQRLATAYQPTAEGLLVWDPPEGQGAGRRRSTTEPPGWCRRWMTCWRSRGCCCAAAIRC